MVFTDIVEYNGKHYYIDSRWTIDHGYETMAFLCDSNGNVLCWSDLYCDRYSTEAQMKIGHKKAIENIKEGRFTMTDYEREAKEFLFDCQAEMIIVFDDKARNPDWDDAVLRNRYLFTITTPFGTMKGKFWDSLYNTNKGIKPTEYDILACLEKYDVGTIDDFVREFGYEVHEWADVKRIENTYNAVVKEYQDLCRIFTPEQMEMLREIY